MNAQRRYCLPASLAICVTCVFSASAARADNPWRAPAKPGTTIEQYAPLEQNALPAPAVQNPNAGQALRYPLPSPTNGVARPGAAPQVPSVYGNGDPGYSGYRGYPGGGYGQTYPSPYPGPYSGPYSGPYPGPYSGPYGAPGIDPVLRDSVHGPGARGGLMGGWPWN